MRLERNKASLAVVATYSAPVYGVKVGLTIRVGGEEGIQLGSEVLYGFMCELGKE